MNHDQSLFDLPTSATQRQQRPTRLLRLSMSLLLLVALLLPFLQTPAAHAATVNRDATDSGWYKSDGTHNPNNTNYVVGDLSGPEYRDFFLFDLTGITETINSATFSVDAGSRGGPDPSETWTLFDVTTPNATLQSDAGGVGAFNDLGSGTSYGSVTVPAAGYPAVVNVTLNAAGVAALNAARGSTIAIGGRLTTLNAAADEFIFAFTGGGMRRLILDINTPIGFTVTPTSGLVTTEAGGTASFTVVLNTAPSANVTIPLSSSNTAEGTVGPASLTFTSANWNVAQTVTVTGVNDAIADGNIGYSIVTGAAASTDPNYDNLNAADVSVNNADDDTAGITVSGISGNTSETGGTATFSVVLSSQPTADVSIALSSSNTAEGTVSPASLTFTPGDWNMPQSVTVTGVDDAVDDGDIAYSIVTAAATSSDPNYSARDAADVNVTNNDDDTAGITVSGISSNTSEAGGTGSFSVVLSSQPTGDVTIGLSSNDTTEGTVAPASLTFTSADWNTPQSVTATGVNDSVDDGDIAYDVVIAAATSSDPNYSGRDAADVNLFNTDDDGAGIVVTRGPSFSPNTSEAGGSSSFTVELASQPTADVTIALSSSDTTEGTVAPASLTFTAANWNAPQTVTATGVDDAVDDGDIAYDVVIAGAVSSDPIYNGMDAADISVTNTDDDTAGVTVTTISSNTTEAGGTATFDVMLDSQPTADVSIALSSSDTAEGNVSPATLTFTSADWNVAQSVTATGVDDSIDDGDVAYSIVTDPASSSDLNYDNVNPANQNLLNTDNDTAGITVSAISGNTSETGGTATFTIVLNSQPIGDVNIALSSSNTAEGAVSPGVLTFTSGDWSTAQNVVVTGIDDAVDDGDIAYAIVTGAASSADGNYNTLDTADLNLSNIDDDTADITVSAVSGNTTEASGTATFDVMLDSQPTADVTIALSSSDTTEGTVAPASLTFTSGNWNTPQTVTISGVNDAVDDGDIAYNIVTGAATSSDPNYSARNAADISLFNTDNDGAGVTVSAVSDSITEAGGTGSFTVQLASQPTADVSIALSSSDATEGTVSPASLTFTSANWNVPQTVTVTGVDDGVDDGDIGYTIVIAASISADPVYNGQNAADLPVETLDNDTVGITVSAVSGNTSEAGGTATFTVVLGSQPTADVSIALSSSDATEGAVSPAALTFTSGNWNVPQTVTATGADDAVDDGDIAYSIVTAPASSSDPNYNLLNAANASLTNTDNDGAGVTVSAISSNTTELGGTATFTVVLTSQPTADVSITLSSDDLTEASVSPTLLTFTSANWNTPRTVTVTGVDDQQPDGDISFTIVTGAISSADPAYNGRAVGDVSGNNEDNESRTIYMAAIYH